MTWQTVLMFLVGVEVTMIWLVCFYRIFDYWYDFASRAVGIVSRLLLVTAAIVAAAMLLPTGLAQPLVLGVISYLVYHVLVYWLGILIVQIATR